MIKGVTVTVCVPTTSTDRFGNAVKTYHVYDKFTVGNVLVSPGATADMEAARPDGVTIAYTLHFPKTFTGQLEGCEIELPAPWAGTYRVVGSPGKYIEANTPTKWSMPVEVAAAHG